MGIGLNVDENLGDFLEKLGYHPSITLLNSEGNPGFGSNHADVLEGVKVNDVPYARVRNFQGDFGYFSEQNEQVFGGWYSATKGLVEKDGITYLFAEKDQKEVYVTLEGEVAFGGWHLEALDFLDIDGTDYLFARDEIEEEGELKTKEGLYDVDGNLLGGKTYDSINIVEKSLLEEIIFNVEDHGKKGFLLPDGSIFGGEQGMNDTSTLLKLNDEICLWAENKGMQCIYSQDGEELYGGPHEAINPINIAGIEYLITKDNSSETIRTREGRGIYGGVHTKIVGAREIDGEFLAAVMEGHKLAIVDEAGNKCFGKLHYQEATDGPNRQGIFVIDGITLMKFIEGGPDGSICYYTKRNGEAFGRHHLEEFPDELKIKGKTVKKFKDCLSKKIVHYDIKNKAYFGREHWDEVSSFWWKYDSEGKERDSAEWDDELTGKVYKCFKDKEKFAFFGSDGNPIFENKLESGEATPYHDKIKGLLSVAFEKEGQTLNLVFLNAQDNVSWTRKLTRVFGLFGTLSTFYSMDGNKFESEKEIRAHYGIPENVKFAPLESTEDAEVKVVVPRKTLEMKVISEEKAREIVESDSSEKE